MFAPLFSLLVALFAPFTHSVPLEAHGGIFTAPPTPGEAHGGIFAVKNP